MRLRLRSLTALATLLGTALIPLVAPSALADRAQPAGIPLGLKVYTANVENLLTKHESCPGDWHELVDWIGTHSTADVILLQQVSGAAQARAFTARLNKINGFPDFAYLVAEKHPNGTRRCNGEKRHQTNAIIYNAVNLSVIPNSVHTWRSVHRGPDPRTQCEPNPQSRTRNLKARFALGGPTVTVASVHWPTVASGGKSCYDNNARLTDRELEEPGYSGSGVQIVGGDTNVTAGKKWHSEMTSRGFRDAMAGDPTWTHIANEGAGPKRRIDYLFARRGTSRPGSFYNPYTVTFAKAQRAQRKVEPGDHDPRRCDTYPRARQKGCAYSEHRSVVARVVF